MRKINDTELQEMIKVGKSQKEAALFYGVSPSAINQRIKKLEAYAAPESFKKLTGKEQKFVLAKLEGRTNQDAVKSAYEVTTNESAKSMATVLMRDPDISVAISDLMAQSGIPRRRRIERLRDMIECPDLSVVGKGLDMSFKLAGDYAPERIEVISDHEIRMLIATISNPAEQDREEVQAIEVSD